MGTSRTERQDETPKNTEPPALRAAKLGVIAAILYSTQIQFYSIKYGSIQEPRCSLYEAVFSTCNGTPLTTDMAMQVLMQLGMVFVIVWAISWSLMGLFGSKN